MPAAREDVAKLREQIALSDAKQLEAMNVQTWRFVTWITAMMRHLA
jgi:hypothetical protein